MNPSILVVDDSELVRSSLLAWLGTAFPGFRLLAASDGEEAVALACANRPRLVLMDVRMEKMSGIEAARRIRAGIPQTRVVMLSMHDASEYRAGAAEAGAAGYVLKSRAHRELIPLMESLLFQPAAGVWRRLCSCSDRKVELDARDTAGDSLGGGNDE